MGAGVFILSGLVSLVLMGGFLAFFVRISPVQLRAHWRMLTVSIGLVYVVFNVLYFTNIIPPIPLSLKEIGVYHTVAWETNGAYRFTYELEKRFYFFERPSRTFHRIAEAPVYVYSAVFAPTDLKTKIFHRWSYFDERRNIWVTTDNLSFVIVGGRDGGWRGFTMKQNISPATWRVEVMTDRDQLLGRTTFGVITASEAPELISKQE